MSNAQNTAGTVGLGSGAELTVEEVATLKGIGREAARMARFVDEMVSEGYAFGDGTWLPAEVIITRAQTATVRA